MGCKTHGIMPQLCSAYSLYMQGKRVAVSGSGNVAIYAAEKLLELGAKVITLSDSNGTFVEEDGFTREGLDAVDDLKVARKGKLTEYKSKTGWPIPYRFTHCCYGIVLHLTPAVPTACTAIITAGSYKSGSTHAG